MAKLNKILPHGELVELFKNVWFVQGQVKLPMWMPFKMSKTMTVVRNPKNDELTLVNSMPLSPNGLKQLESLGKVANTLRIGAFHGRDDNFYRAHYQTKAYAISGQVYSKKIDKSQASAGYFEPDVLLDENSELPIPEASLKILRSSQPVEALLHLHQDGGILISADALHNTPESDRYYNFFAKMMMKKMGFLKPYNVGPGWIEFARPSKEEIRTILDLDFQHVLPGHGVEVIGNAKEKYRPSLEGELKGCH